ncbi:DUF3556 family protein [Thermoleophilia bacterium SCSIO 60948]|nr:DUF3556 family protein [Thermoleophilia bacterium SCSIO 60948]
MAFMSPADPPVDLDEWSRRTHLERIIPAARDWAENGSGVPSAVYLLYIVKLVVFSVAGLAIIGATSDLGGLGSIGEWWTEPIVFQKLCVWLILWEILGLGCGSMPLTFRFIPPIGGALYWLRRGTVRQPPWPDRVPLTAGTTRTPLDVALYIGVLGVLVYLLVAGGSGSVIPDGAPTLLPVEPSPDLLPVGGILALLALLAALGLRDKVAFLAARPEVYLPLLIVACFPPETMIVGWQFVFLCIWLGAASSKLNRHFPFVVSVMISNTPWNRSRRMKRDLYKGFPDDLRPGRNAAFAAHLGTVIEFTLPLILFFGPGGLIGTVAVIGMLIFHVHITSTFPLAVPLEWNLFMLFGIVFLFGHYGDVPLSTFDPLLLAILLCTSVALPVLGNLMPDKISFLPSMRYYAGNWATSQWLFRREGDAEGKLDAGVKKPAAAVIEQLSRLYGRQMAEYLLYKGLAFRSMHHHGRALNGLVFRAADGDVESFHVREGELVSGIVNGWNFGDGHLHDEGLLQAVQERCGFAPGELRVVCLESQPVQVQRQRYRILDAADGLIEEGTIEVADMCSRQPWLDGRDGEFPVTVTGPGAVAVGDRPVTAAGA